MEITVKEHLLELKKSFLSVSIFAFIIFAITFFFFSPILGSNLISYYDLATPVVSLSPSENINSMLILSAIVTSIFFIPLFVFSLINFAFEKKSKHLFKNIGFGLMLGLGGFILGITYMSKTILQGLTQYGFTEQMWSIGSVISLVSGISFILAISFQTVWFIPYIEKTKIITLEHFKKARPFILVIVLILSSVLTPPDVLSQVMLAVPIIMSYETGLMITKMNGGKKE